TYELYGMSRPTYNEKKEGKPLNQKSTGLPDVFRISPRDTKNKPDFVSMSFDLQHWMLKINLEASTGVEYTRQQYFDWFNAGGSSVNTMVNWLTSACTEYRSHTNKAGMDNSRNYLTGERYNLGEPKFAQLVTGWFTGIALTEDGEIVKRYINGIGECYAFQCINANRGDYWNYSPLREWWLFDRPLVTGRAFITDKSGTRISRDNIHIPYPQFNGRLVFPVMLPKDDVVFVPISNVVVQTSGNSQKNWI